MKQRTMMTLAIILSIALRTVNASAQGGKELVANGDFEGSDFSSFVYKNADGIIKTVTTNDIVDDNGNHCLKIQSQENVAETWESQFFIKLPEGVTLSPGTKVYFSMRVKTSRNTTITTQGHNGPGVYLCWNIFGSFDVSTDWYNIEGVFTVPYNDSPDASPSDKVNTIAFDLNCDLNHSITFFFDDVSIVVPNSDVIVEESISIDDMSLKSGEVKDLNVMLSSAVNNKVGVQFDVVLPDGISLEKDSKGSEYQLSSNQANDLTCKVKDLGHGISRFIIYSKSLQKLNGGDLLCLHLKAASNINSGNHAVSLGKISFSDTNGNVTKGRSVNAYVMVTSTYMLTYMIDGRVYKEVEIDYGATITPEAVPTKEGYSFSGWSEIPSTMPANDVTVSGTFTINKYRLVYMVDGVEYMSFEIEYGSSVTPEAAPTKEGYTFSGWSDIPSTMPANDVTVSGTFTQVDYSVGNIIYEITGEGTTVIKGGEQTGEVTIQTSVVINGNTYHVTAIADNAFKDNQDITSLTIPEGIASIGDNAFNGCSNLIVINIGKDVQSIGSKAFANLGTASSTRTRGEDVSIVVNSYAESVPQTALDAFENTPIEKDTLYVVDELINAYRMTSPWSRFGTILGFEEAVGINAIVSNTTKAQIYDMQGNRLDNVHKGVNIIRMKNGKTKKIVVK